MANVTGVIDYSFNLYRIQPTQGADYTAANLRPSEPEPVGGNLQIAAMNTLNYFLTIDTGAAICGPLKNAECRGADTAEEFTRQRAKLLAALSGLDAAVVGLNELENTTGVEPLADIVAGLNVIFGDGTYAYINTGTIGTDAIKVGLIYQPGLVTPVGTFQVLKSDRRSALPGYQEPPITGADLRRKQHRRPLHRGGQPSQVQGVRLQ